jgi:replicative DNA helicase
MEQVTQYRTTIDPEGISARLRAIQAGLPPHSNEAEQGVLACCLLDPKTCISEIQASGIECEAFYDVRHQRIWTSMQIEFDKTGHIEVTTLVQHLRDAGKLGDVGGFQYLAGLPDLSPSPANLPFYVEILRDKWTLRKIMRHSAEIQAKIMDEHHDSEMILDEYESGALSIRSKSTADRSIRDVVRSAMDALESVYSHQGAVGGITTGLVDLDRKLDGLHAGDLVILAGFPGTGKTTLAVNICEHIAMDLGLPIGIFSLEMSAESIATRILASRSRLNTRTIRHGQTSEYDFSKIALAAGKLSHAPVIVSDVSDLTITQCRAKARQWEQKNPTLALIVVDYIQLMMSPSKTDNREQEIARISTGLKAMARELGVTVLALSQLNDDGKLRESRRIGQDADVVMRLESDDLESSEVRLNVQKQRNGSVGIIPLVFFREFTRFESAAK